MKFSIEDFFSECDQVLSFLLIWSDLPKKPLMENFIFCRVWEDIFLNKFFQNVCYLSLDKFSLTLISLVLQLKFQKIENIDCLITFRQI